MKVYVVTAGCYSDYHIEKVFTNREQARLFALLDPDREVETYETDKVAIDVPEKTLIAVKCWIRWGSLQVHSIKLAKRELVPYVDEYDYFYFTVSLSNGKLYRSIITKGKDSKLLNKMACDMFAVYCYEHDISKEDILKKNNLRYERGIVHPVSDNPVEKIISKELTDKINEMYEKGEPLPDFMTLLQMEREIKNKKE